MLEALKINKKECVTLLILLFVTVALRLPFLGYSDFYGDETKTFYWDKTVPAQEFLLNQRKGPVQFIVVWVMQELVGGFDELLTRVPFALAGIGAVFALYFFIKELFDWKVASITASLFSLTGFYIAFSRTIQYQSFLLLFGFLANWFFVAARKLEKHKQGFFILSGVFIALAFLSHWDALFFVIPIGFQLVYFFKDFNFKRLGIYLLLPFVIILGAFFIPYCANGFMKEQTFGYIERRLSGGAFLPNSSPYTIFVYNHFIWFFLPLIFALGAFFLPLDTPAIRTWKINSFIFWLVLSGIVFQFAFSNPGTHIHNYLIPLYVLAGVGFIRGLNFLHSGILKRFLVYGFTLLMTGNFVYNAFIFLPNLHLGYPWRSTSYKFLHLKKADKSKHLFLYGFPYNRGWRKMREYLLSKDGVRNVYTNDNATVAKFYLKEYDIISPGSNFFPQYYILVRNSHELKFPGDNFLRSYSLEKVIYKDGVPISSIYKLK